MNFKFVKLFWEMKKEPKKTFPTSKRAKKQSCQDFKPTSALQLVPFSFYSNINFSKDENFTHITNYKAYYHKPLNSFDEVSKFFRVLNSNEKLPTENLIRSASFAQQF